MHGKSQEINTELVQLESIMVRLHELFILYMYYTQVSIQLTNHLVGCIVTCFFILVTTDQDSDQDTDQDTDQDEGKTGQHTAYKALCRLYSNLLFYLVTTNQESDIINDKKSIYSISNLYKTQYVVVNSSEIG